MARRGFASSGRTDSARTTGALRSLILVLTLACLTLTRGLAATPSWIGASTAGGLGTTIARAIKAAPGGGYYITGQFDTTAYFSGHTVVSRGGADVFLARYGSSGNLLWIVTAGGPGDDAGWSLDLDADGNIYMTGWFDDSGTFNSVNVAPQTRTEVGNTIFLARYSPEGDLAWVETGTSVFDGQSFEGLANNGYGVAVDSADGLVYITALTAGVTIFSSEDGKTGNGGGVSKYHMVVAQYGTDGNFRWAQTDMAGYGSVPFGIAVDNEGDAYITGYYQNYTTFYSTNRKAISVIGFSSAQSAINPDDDTGDAFLAKYDRYGDVLWVNHIGGYTAVGNSVAVSPSGDVSLVGYAGDVPVPDGDYATLVSTQGPEGAVLMNTLYRTDPYNPDAFIVTYTPEGVLVRAIRIGHAGSEDAKGVAYDESGNLYVVGISEQSPVLRANLFLLKYQGGTLEWEQKAESSVLWQLQGSTPTVSAGSDGKIYVAGAYQHWARFGPSTLNGGGVANMFIAEIATQ